MKRLLTTAALGLLAAAGLAAPPPVATLPPSYTLTDPVASTDPNNAYADQWTVGFSGVGLTPRFPAASIHSRQANVYSGWNAGPTAGNPYAKLSAFVTLDQLIARGCGQRVVHGVNAYGYGCGDLFSSGENLWYWGGATASGDEGQGFRTINLTQGTSLARAAVVSVVQPAGAGTTCVEAIAAGASAQAVALASVAGLSPGMWLVFDPAAAGTPGYQDMEAVKLTSVNGAAGTVGGVFLRNHAKGAAVAPAVVLKVSTTAQFGQQRWLVNLTRPSYSAGTASCTAGALAVAGVGTTWAATMAGGSALNSGAISFAADDYSAAPFAAGAGRLRAWYPISAVASPTALSIVHRSASGIGGYTGTATAAGAYEVRGAAPILAFDPPFAPATVVVLAPNSFPWAAGDSVECAISPDADVGGEYMRVAAWMPGGTYRGVRFSINQGARPFGSAFQAQGNAANLGNAFGIAFQAGADTKVGIGLNVVNPQEAFARTTTTGPGNQAHIIWDGDGKGIHSDVKNNRLVWQGDPRGRFYFGQSGGKVVALDPNAPPVVAPANPPTVTTLADVIAAMQAAGLAK